MRDRITLPGTSRTQQTTRRYGLLLSLLGLLVLLESITVFVVLASQQYATERALRDYTRELMQNVVDATRENAAGYLRQAEDSVSLAARITEAALLSEERPAQLERYLLEQLRVVPQLDALYFGDVEGNFVFSKRSSSPAAGSFLTKLIRNALPAEERVTLISRDPGLAEVSRRLDPEDRYDPRKRPWFELARTHDGAVWTAPYIFYTSRQPGLTVARAVHDSDGQLRGVVGADIELSALSGFLTNQRIGRTGAAFIVHSNGDVLAHPHAETLAQQIDGDGLRLRRPVELDPITARAGAHLREGLPGDGSATEARFDTFEIEGRRYLSMHLPLLGQGEGQWLMVAYAPEDELAQTIREGQRESIYLGVSVSLLMVTAAVLLVLLIAGPINRLQRQAREDPLTGLLNRRSFDENGAKMLARIARMGEPLSAIMIDIDCFKPINDTHGHAVGDEVLLVVAQRIRRGLSEEDLLARYGGEEFAVLLPGTTLDEAEQVAERLRTLVGAKPVQTSMGPLAVTISLGVAETANADSSLVGLLDLADRGLLAAKRQGRDCVAAIQGRGAQHSDS